MTVGVSAMVGVARVGGLPVTVGGLPVTGNGRRRAPMLMGMRPLVARALVLRAPGAAATSAASRLASASWRLATASASRGLAAASVLILFHLVRLTCTDESGSRNRRKRNRRSEIAPANSRSDIASEFAKSGCGGRPGGFSA